MIRVTQIKLQPNHNKQDLVRKVAQTLRISEQEILDLQIKKQSLDARKKSDIKYVYSVDVEVSNEEHVMKKQRNSSVSIVKEKPYHFQVSGTQMLSNRPVIIGSGPAGMFCAYLLAQHGYRPIVFERGKEVTERVKDIESFWNGAPLNPESNVQFGEGGAGTFSDGKLNTLVKDAFGRNRKVLEIFVKHGAPEEILYQNKPHIGTDILIDVVRSMRRQIIAWGGSFYFQSCLTDLKIEEGSLKSISIKTAHGIKEYKTELMILAIGHSARDTFTMLYEKQFPLFPKAFAVGVRVEHLQSMIDASQYGTEHEYPLPAASYKVTANLTNGRGVYSFCMCPGGYVVNASSEEGLLAINGMSYHARNGKNANSAIIVTVSPKDYGEEHPLSGMMFQRELEKKAFEIGQGKIPVQRFEDYCNHRVTDSFGKVIPEHKGAYAFANIREIFPEEINQSLEDGIKSFDKQIHGFANGDTLLSGVESRTSSPIRIERNETLQIENTGIYPCGEGAGYAGGITSAAMDGMKVAEMIAAKFAPFDSI